MLSLIPPLEPTRWRFRLQKLMLKPVWRRTAKVGLPCALVCAGAAWLLWGQNHLERITARTADLYQRAITHSDVMLTTLTIEGASADLEQRIRHHSAVLLPADPFDLDLAQLRADYRAIEPVADAVVRIRPNGVLHVRITMHRPAALWRNWGGLFLIGSDGHIIDTARSRADHPDMSVLAGEGADRATGEALALIELHDVLARDIAVVDLRLPHRLTLRLAEPALQNGIETDNSTLE